MEHGIHKALKIRLVLLLLENLLNMCSFVDLSRVKRFHWFLYFYFKNRENEYYLLHIFFKTTISISKKV